MKILKILGFTIFISLSVIFSLSFFRTTNVLAASLPDLKMVVAGPSLVVVNSSRSFDFTFTSTGGFFPNLAPVITNTIQTATGITDPNNPTGVTNYTYTYNLGSLRDYTNYTRSKGLVFSTEGKNYIRACVDKSSISDANGLIAESDETNNCSHWFTVNVVHDPFTDIQTSSISPTNFTAGVDSYFNAEVSNHGPSDTGYLGVNSFQNLFESADGFSSLPNGFPDYTKPINLVDYNTSALSFVNVLLPEGTYIMTSPDGVSIPQKYWQDRKSISSPVKFNFAGTKYVRACADKDSVIKESDETNNCGPWTKITISPSPISSKFIVSKVGTGLGTVISESGYSKNIPGIPNSYINCGSDCSEDISNISIDPTIISSDGRPSAVIHIYPKASDGSFFAGWGYPDSYTNSDINKMNEVTPVESTAYIPTPASMDIKSFPVFNLNDVPSVACSNVKNVTKNSATIECSMVREGVNVTVSGVVWGGPDTPPTLADSIGKTTDGSVGVRGFWTSTITGLTPGTDYSVRGYATNSIGTGYGGWWRFKTLASSSSDLIILSDAFPSTVVVKTDNSFSATIKNNGTASTVSSFTNLFQTATNIDNPNNPIGLKDYSVSGMSALASGATAVTSKSISFPSIGTYYIRACADKSSAGDRGVITELDENNNCGQWKTVTVDATGFIDLTASNNISPTFAIVGVSNSFSATIKNNGTASTVSSFTNLFQTATNIDNPNNPIGLKDYSVSGMSALASGATAVTSKSISFPSIGTYYIRACADKSSAGDRGVITELDENNNCGQWSIVIVDDGSRCNDSTAANYKLPGICFYGSDLCIDPTAKNYGEKLPCIDTCLNKNAVNPPLCTINHKGDCINGATNPSACDQGIDGTCSDKIKNGNEEGVDCGGRCPNACGSNGNMKYKEI